MESPAFGSGRRRAWRGGCTIIWRNEGEEWGQGEECGIEEWMRGELGGAARPGRFFALTKSPPPATVDLFEIRGVSQGEASQSGRQGERGSGDARNNNAAVEISDALKESPWNPLRLRGLDGAEIVACLG